MIPSRREGEPDLLVVEESGEFCWVRCFKVRSCSSLPVCNYVACRPFAQNAMRQAGIACRIGHCIRWDQAARFFAEPVVFVVVAVTVWLAADSLPAASSAVT
jgi:hypothetical protein